MPIEAALSVIIEHREGPTIGDPDHIRRWLCADGAWMSGARNGFSYEVCPAHADPDECECTDDTISIYFVSIVAADWEE